MMKRRKTSVIFLLILLTMTELINGKSDCEYGVSNSVVILDGLCYKCPEGLFGTNCSQACPIGYHGAGCLSECNCEKNYFCHPVFGCVLLGANGSVLRNDNTTTILGSNNNTKVEPVVYKDIHYYGLTISQWSLIGFIMMAINILLLIITFSMCACRRGPDSKDLNTNQVLGALATLVDGRYNNHTFQQTTQGANLYTDNHPSNDSQYTLPRPTISARDEPNIIQKHPPNSNGSFTCHNGGPVYQCAGPSKMDQNLESNYDLIDERMTQVDDSRKRPMKENIKHVGTRISQFFANTYWSLEAKFPLKARSPSAGMAHRDSDAFQTQEQADSVANTYFMLEKPKECVDQTDTFTEFGSATEF